MTTRTAVVVDYGMGNVLSVVRALEHCGATVDLTAAPDSIRNADRLILPGVGAFGDCMEAFLARGLREPVMEFIARGRPMLGLCVGMQILFDRSLEFGDYAGLGIIQGEIRAIPKTNRQGYRHKTPHIGWAEVIAPEGRDARSWCGTILDGIEPGESMYFVHSYTAWPIEGSHRLADTLYGGHQIAAAVRKDNVNGTQFHPEKSSHAGLTLLNNFLRL